MPLRRTIKNVVKNFSDVQVKVREATSNDPWGPSSTLMGELADLTYNHIAFTEIMQMIWKRMNDHGKNWRHVYKALVLLEYIIKTGTDRVAQQCKENIYAIQTLKDFQHVEEGKDQGVNVREKAKLLVSLLQDEERLKNERAKALKAKERLAQSSTAFGSTTQPHDPAFVTPYQDTRPAQPPIGGDVHHIPPQPAPQQRVQRTTSIDIEQAMPATPGEEELQLQLALAMSKEEAQDAQRKARSDDLKLQMALSESRKVTTEDNLRRANGRLQQQALLDLGGAGAAGAAGGTGSGVAGLQDPWGAQGPAPSSVAPSDPWGGAGPQSKDPAPTDPWAPISSGAAAPASDPWSAQTSAAGGGGSTASSNPWDAANPSATASNDPWAGGTATEAAAAPAQPEDDFAFLSGRTDMRNGESAGMSEPSSTEQSATLSTNATANGRVKKPEDFLGANSGLVDLNSLVAKPNPSSGGGVNPFAMTAVGVGAGSSGPSSTTAGGAASNPFHAQQQKQSRGLPMNQLAAQNTAGFTQSTVTGTILPAPLLPVGAGQGAAAATATAGGAGNPGNNPFL